MLNECTHITDAQSASPIVITLCSGKGGVGKSVLTANISTQLSKYAKVLIWDTNIQFPNAHLLFGVEPLVRLNEVYEQKVSVNTAIYQIDNNLYILSGSPADINHSAFVDNYVLHTFEDIINSCDFDFIIIDTPAGYSDDILQCCSISDKILLTVTDEPTSMLDAYGLIKIMMKRIDLTKIELLVNNVIDTEDAEEITHKFNLVTNKFLHLSVPTLGFVPYDRAVRQSILMQEILINTEPNSEVGKAIQDISSHIFDTCTNLLIPKENK